MNGGGWKKILILAGFNALLILGIVFLVFKQKSPDKANNNIQFYSTVETKSDYSLPDLQNEAILYKKRVKALDNYLIKDANFFENLFYSFESPSKIYNNSLVPDVFDGSFIPKVSPEPDIFVFPEFYVEYLNEMQDIMIADGALGQKTIFNTNDKVISFLDIFLDYLVNEGVVPASQQEQLHKGLRVALVMLKEEARGQSSYFNLNSPLGLITVNASARRSFSLVSDIFRRMMEFKNAYAQGECYQEGASGGGGSNLPAPCCNCRLPNGQPIGCLNKVCAGGAAIWDSQTGICGCGK